jgi:hypothetical protein
MLAHSMPLKLNIISHRFDRLLVICEAGRSKFGQVLWRCQCDCGAVVVTPSGPLKNGRTKSCGCLRRDRQTTHGLDQHPLRRTHRGMLERCYNPKNKRFASYGGRGIAVCDRWRSGEGSRTGLELFVEDMGPKPTPKHTIDRKDNDGNYEPGNCRWATKAEQNKNRNCRPDARVFLVGGRHLTVQQACALHGLNESTVYARLKDGRSVEEAFTAGRLPRRY